MAFASPNMDIRLANETIIYRDAYLTPGRNIDYGMLVQEKGDVKVLDIDLTKQSFQLHGVDETGQAILRKKLPRG